MGLEEGGRLGWKDGAKGDSAFGLDNGFMLGGCERISDEDRPSEGILLGAAELLGFKEGQPLGTDIGENLSATTILKGQRMGGVMGTDNG
mmetsp:Transcript_44615/g.82753  ORF Transcript_44615/g.82753 Transcript_44615/m.82753 type:complete len:90 (+) Transcript_44615:151-420(+)